MKYMGYCPDCEGTGIYRGFGEGRGVGAICRTCNGTGALEREVKEFKQRRMRADIQTVRWPVRMEDQIEKMPSVTYQEFLAGKLPSKNE